MLAKNSHDYNRQQFYSLCLDILKAILCQTNESQGHFDQLIFSYATGILSLIQSDGQQNFPVEITD